MYHSDANADRTIVNITILNFFCPEDNNPNAIKLPTRIMAKRGRYCSMYALGIIIEKKQ
jgi:hypothetical protein